MKIGDTFKRNNREYTVIDVFAKKYREQEVLLCTTKCFKECFQRFDVEGGREYEKVRMEHKIGFKW